MADQIRYEEKIGHESRLYLQKCEVARRMARGYD